MGKHTITVGTHNEFFGFRNLFIRDNFGTYTFNTRRPVRSGPGASSTTTASRRRSNPKQAADFGVNQFGFYVGDQWRVRTER